MKAAITSVAALAFFASSSARAAYVEDCSESLSAKWGTAVAAHPIDPAKHVIVVHVDVPVSASDVGYRHAIERLRRTLPSFEEGFGSGVLAGCCSVPVWGTVSSQDFAKLSKSRFGSLCEVGRRSRSTSVGVQVEYRQTYERGEGAAAYFFVNWNKKAVR